MILGIGVIEVEGIMGKEWGGSVAVTCRKCGGVCCVDFGIVQDREKEILEWSINTHVLCCKKCCLCLLYSKEYRCKLCRKRDGRVNQ